MTPLKLSSLRACALILAAFAAALAGCSSSPATCAAGDASCNSGIDESAACAVSFSGNYGDNFEMAAGCGGLTHCLSAADCKANGEDAKDWLLTLNAKPMTANVIAAVSLDLGPTPSAGTYTDATVTTWYTSGGTATMGCRFSAGNEVVPTGSFELTLTSVDTAAGTAHGTLQVDQYISAPATTNCGPSDVEQVDFEF